MIKKAVAFAAAFCKLLEIMKNNQEIYIEYAKQFAEKNKCHIWLGGSFAKGTATLFSDVDISVCCDAEKLNKFIYGYKKPVYISYTINPLGILIIIYEDGVAVDLEIIEKIDISDSCFFHTDDIKLKDYIRNEIICIEFSLNSDVSYQISRLFHRSLIKYLSGKQDIGVNIANEIATFYDANFLIDVENYKNRFLDLLKSYNERYPLSKEYVNILYDLIEKLKE